MSLITSTRLYTAWSTEDFSNEAKNIKNIICKRIRNEESAETEMSPLENWQYAGMKADGLISQQFLFRRKVNDSPLINENECKNIDTPTNTPDTTDTPDTTSQTTTEAPTDTPTDTSSHTTSDSPIDPPSSNTPTEANTFSKMTNYLKELKTKLNLNDLKFEMNPKVAQFLKTGGIAALITGITILLRGMQKEQEMGDLVKDLFRECGLSFLGAGALQFVTKFVFENLESIKSALFGVSSEILENSKVSEQVFGGVFGPVICTVIESIHWLFNSKSIYKSKGIFGYLKDFIVMFTDSLVTGLGISFISGVIASAFPAWATILLMICIGLLVRELKQSAKQQNKSIIKCGLQGFGNVFVTIGKLFIPASNAQINDSPQELKCNWSQVLLKDPVFIGGNFYERSIVTQQLNKNNGMWTCYSLTVTEESIKECPEMKTLVQFYRKRFNIP